MATTGRTARSWPSWPRKIINHVRLSSAPRRHGRQARGIRRAAAQAGPAADRTAQPAAPPGAGGGPAAEAQGLVLGRFRLADARAALLESGRRCGGGRGLRARILAGAAE